ncbi:MAG: O-antigen ligase family protein [Kiritimatiellae bacterium]|jgi:hypothetical protein|nr:O-antigen ligase family protein [Kiritimatiellia bacterium]
MLKTSESKIDSIYRNALDKLPWFLLNIMLPIGLSLITVALLAINVKAVLVLPGLFFALLFVYILTKRLDFCIYTLLSCSLLFDQFYIRGLPIPFTMRIPFFVNLNIPTGISALVMNPIECILGLTVVIFIVRAATSRDAQLRKIPNLGISIIFLGMLLFYTVYGLSKGGDVKASMWEIRALYYLCGLYFFTTQLIRTREQVKIIMWIAIISIHIKGLETFFYRYGYLLHFSTGDLECIAGHEDSLFFSTILVLTIAMGLLKYYGPEFWVSLVLCPFTFMSFMLNQRRIVYGTFGLSLIFVLALLPKKTKILALKIAAPLSVLMIIYCVAFWNSGSSIAMPVQQIKSVFASGEGEDVDTSNLYREKEKYNLERTIEQNPLGLGFGRKYLIEVPLDAIDFPLWDYIPHNCIYWIWTKTGFPGFIIFWMFFGLSITQAVIDYRKVKDRYEQSVSLMVITFIISQICIAYYDLQIVMFFRNMIYLGIAMALPVVFNKIHEAEDAL